MGYNTKEVKINALLSINARRNTARAVPVEWPLRFESCVGKEAAETRRESFQLVVDALETNARILECVRLVYDE